MIRTAVIKGFANGTQGPADAAPTITVTRNDTQAVVATGTGTLQGSGVTTLYTFDWTEPTPPVTGYTYTAVGTIDGAAITRVNSNIAGTPTPSNPPGTCQVTITILNSQLSPVPNLTLNFEMTSPPPAVGFGYADLTPPSATTDNTGVATIDLAQQAQYRINGLFAFSTGLNTKLLLAPFILNT